jgi:hypothetical protein
MINTNLLLSIGLHLVANFTNSVSLPDEAIPKTREDLRSFVVGTPYSPVDLYLVAKSGPEFWIRDGTIHGFRSPDSFFQLQDPSRLKEFAGTSTLTTNELVDLATATLKRLRPGDGALPAGTPTILPAGAYQGKPLPFFRVSWPARADSPVSTACTLEIDGRSRKVVYVQLWDPAFYDMEVAGQISNQVYKADAVVTKPSKPSSDAKPKYVLQHPSIAYVEESTKAWLAFCEKFGIEPGNEHKIADVNWDKTWLYTNRALSVTHPVCQVRFMNGACYECIDGVVRSVFAPDSLYIGFWSDESEKRYQGTIQQSWRALAKSLEETLIDKFQIPAEELAPYEPGGRFKLPELGGQGTTRVVIDWRIWPKKPGETVWIDESHFGFAAEFDLTTGKTKWINIEAPGLVRLLYKTQLKKDLP